MVAVCLSQLKLPAASQNNAKCLLCAEVDAPAMDLHHVSVMVWLACGFADVCTCEIHGFNMVLPNCITDIAAYHTSICYLSHIYLLFYSIS